MDQLKLSAPFQQLLAPLDSLSDDVQRIVNRVLAYVLPSIPVVILLVMIFINYQARQSRTSKEKLLSRMDNIGHLSKEVSGFKNLIVSPASVADKQGMQTRLNTLARQAGFGGDLVTIKNFLQEPMGNLNKSLVDITFKELSTPQFTSFLTKLVANEKMKVDRVELKKVGTLLKGSLNLIHFSKPVAIVDEGAKK